MRWRMNYVHTIAVSGFLMRAPLSGRAKGKSVIQTRETPLSLVPRFKNFFPAIFPMQPALTTYA